MISPTGLGVRSDSEGHGAWGSRRGSRLHKGVDYECVPGQEVVAPLDMHIVRLSLPKAGSSMSGIMWATDCMYGKMFYFSPYTQLIGRDVTQGQPIGVAQDVSMDYGLVNMRPHIHLQIDSIDPTALMQID